MAKKPQGKFAAKKLKERRKQFKFSKKDFYKRYFDLYKKTDPLEGSPQGKGIVLKKVEIEIKQPHSGLRKCVKVQLTKNGRVVTAHVPGWQAIEHIDEHDTVLVERAGGGQRGAYGDIPGVKFKVIKVNDVSLEEIVRGRKEKPVR